MVDRTSVMAWLYAATGRFCSAMAEVKASITVPSSSTVVPAMSRQATVIRVIENVSSAIAGEQVMPRPPGPVTSTTPGSGSDRW